MQNQMKDVLQRLSKLEDDFHNNTLRIQSRSQRIANLEADNEFTKLLAEEARAIRMRFLDVYQRNAFRADDKQSHWDRKTITLGEAAAHDGHIMLDAVLFQDGSRRSDQVFEPIYGISLFDFISRYKAVTTLHQVFNHMATIVVEATRWETTPSVAMRQAFLLVLEEVGVLLQQQLKVPSEISTMLLNKETDLGRAFAVYEGAFFEEKARLGLLEDEQIFILREGGSD